ncbi:Fanconi anemia group I protein [Orussus abietinus]|uniref:Fanconi anemia group I protein n=1 Tax=Orussus abietinus TaxID=222816 RepID=UPI0006256CAC|nr:Fanconi anemia group I protein [Orussus abietinus]
MYAKIRGLSSKKDSKELKNFVENANIDELSDTITARICNPEIPKVFGDILQSFTESETSQTNKRKLIKHTIKALHKTNISSYQADSIINCIVMEFPRFSKAHLIKLVELCQISIRKNDDNFTSWKDLLPRLLEILEDEKHINYKGSEISGMDYKSRIIEAIISTDWEPIILTSLAKMFGDMILEKNDYNVVVRALCNKLPEVELTEMPPLVHQLLKLCQHRDGSLLFETLRKYFAKQYAEAPNTDNQETSEMICEVTIKDVREIESTVLYHIHQAVQLNYKSLKDYLRYLKSVTNSPEFILDPFNMSVLLLMSDVYEEQVFDILKASIIRKIQDDENCKKNAWFRKIIPEEWNVLAVVDKVVKDSKKDRQLALKSLMDFAFILMGTEQRGKFDATLLWKMGNKILQKLVKKRHEIGVTVIQILTEKIISGGCLISQYTDCLAFMCRKFTMTILSCQIFVISLLEQLIAVPGVAGIQILHAILPLIRISPTIRDTLILTLRKALYRKGIDTRQMAVIGFLQLLKNLKVSSMTALSQNCSTSSNTTSSVTSMLTQATIERHAHHGKSNPTYDAAVCSEILTILNKCFVHVANVRLHLYQGLYDAVSKNSDLSEPVLQMLIIHFNQFYEPDEDTLPPLKFDLCTNIQGVEAVLLEPIGDLIMVIQKLYVKVASNNFALLDRLAIMLESLCKRMSRSELEHLSLDDGSDLLDNLPKAQQKLQSFKLMISTYEALMAFRIMGWSTQSAHVGQNVYSLFKGYSRLVDFSKRINKTKKGEAKKKDKDATNTTIKKSGRSAAMKLPATVLDLDTIYRILSLLFQESVPWATDEQSNSLKSHQDFHHYILHTLIQLLHKAKNLTGLDLERHRDEFGKIYLDIGELLYKKIITEFETVLNTAPQTALLGLECFKDMCDLMCTSYSSILLKFLACICDVELDTDLSTQLIGLIAPLQVLVETSLAQEEDEDTSVKKVPQYLLETILHLVEKIPSNDVSHPEKILKWLKQLPKTQKLDPPVALVVLKLLLLVEERWFEHGEIHKEICTQLCEKIGTVDKTEILIEETLNIIDENTALQVHSELNTSLTNKINHMTWILDRLKAEQIIANTPGIEDESRREQLREKERSLCRQLAFNIQTLQILTNVAIGPGSNTEVTFKNLQHLYNLLSNFTKYLCGKSTAQNPAFQSIKFIQVVQLAGKLLKATCYELITFTEQNQTKNKKTGDTQAQRNRILKETKSIPNVIKEIERFDQEILLLSKKTGIPLEEHIKHSVTRDFRIKNTELVEALEKMDTSLMVTQQSTDNVSRSEQPENETVSSEEQEEVSPPKRAKRKVKSQTTSQTQN